ncbi:UNVERIFIED_CONTAM: hypothetical protein FKN15_053134 [Acipenser sinensis]
MATQRFPRAKIITSSLFPRTDFPLQVIQGTNSRISRSCASLPNMQVVHRSTLCTQHLYDDVHMNQEGMCVFTKTSRTWLSAESPMRGAKERGEVPD